MPITVRPSAHGSSSWTGAVFKRSPSPERLLKSVLADEGEVSSKPARLLQSSFGGLRKEDYVFSAKNGFVHACLEAYNQHHSLVIRPDDVWLAILTQLSFYVNAHAEAMRPLFVGHQGRRHLHVEAELDGLDHGRMALMMTSLLEQNLKDINMADWILPAFSTTTPTDETAASIVFMGTMRKYFTYSWGTRCGIPFATLLGQLEDWVDLRQRVERLTLFGEEPARWLMLLRHVLDGFVATFYEPDSDATMRFWQTICNEHMPNGSGVPTYSGWITAFSFWDEQGTCLHHLGNSKRGVTRLSRSDMPAGFAKVHVTLLDKNAQIRCEMVAGSVAIALSRSQERTRRHDEFERAKCPGNRYVGLDQVQPGVGWFLYKT